MGAERAWRALVLGGGGATGEFQVGALPVLSRIVDRFDFYAGVGVGALHATILAQYPKSFPEGVDVMLSLWKRFQRQQDLLDVPFGGAGLGTLGALISERGFAHDSVYGNRTLRRLVDEYVAWDRLSEQRNWGIEVTSLTDGLVYAITNDPALSEIWNRPPRTLKLKYEADQSDDAFLGRVLRNFIVAAGAVPLMLPPVDILGHRFVEGGLRDFLPVELAVHAFGLAQNSNPDLAPEFYVVDNYTAEIQPEAHELLDSGTEIVMRAIKIMTVEMAQNDFVRARALLNGMNVVASIHVLRPRIDFRLNPLDFDDHVRRRKMRDEGATVAAMKFSAVDTDLDLALAQLSTTPDDAVAADRLCRLVRGRASSSPSFAASRERPAIVAPRNLDELYVLMNEARENGKHLKGVGHRYAFSPVDQSDGVIVDVPQHLHNIVPVDETLLKEPALAADLLEFEAGATIELLNAYLWTRGRALINQPGFDQLTFFGVATTGGHGSGSLRGPLSEAIRALHLTGFDAGGALIQRRLERSDGITDPAAWEDRCPRVHLVQDDAVFDAVTVSFGTLGIVTSVVCETRSSFFLEEQRRLTTWDETQGIIDGLLDDPTVHSVHVWLNPYATGGDNTVVLTEYREHPGPRRGHRAWGVTFGGVDELAPIVLALMKRAPAAVPTLLNSALKAVVPSGAAPVLPCWEALNFGAPNQINVDPTNIGVPIVKLADAIEAVLVYLANKTKGARPAYITSPIGLRFTPPARAYLAPQRGRPTCMIELPFLKGTPAALTTIHEIQELLFGRFEGRPHWGQIHDAIDPQWMARIFGDDWNCFREAHALLDPLGVFASVTTEQIGLTPPA
jgi:L-gulono-1,4-lactone dehydrogenase